MTEKVHIGEGTPEYVAFKLWEKIRNAERGPEEGQTQREYMLALYADCLHVVKGNSTSSAQQRPSRR